MFYIMINNEQTADTAETIELARTKGQTLCDAEVLPSTWSIYDANENWVEDIKPSDGRNLSQQIKDLQQRFRQAHRRRSAVTSVLGQNTPAGRTAAQPGTRQEPFWYDHQLQILNRLRSRPTPAPAFRVIASVQELAELPQFQDKIK